jgi:hypothetical protein
VAAAGLLGCVVVAISLPVASVVAGVVLVGSGAIVHLLRAGRRAA